MLAIWSLVPLPFLKPAWTSGSSWLTYYWSLAWRILSITLLVCEMSAIVWQGNSRKISASLTTLKPLIVWITTNCGKFLKRWVYQTTLPASWGTCVKKQKSGQKATVRTWHRTTDWFKLGKDHVKGVYCHPAYLTYMQSTSYEIPGWMNHKLESRLPREISTTSDMQMTPPLWQRAQRGTKDPLDESERGEWKSWLKGQHSEN